MLVCLAVIAAASMVAFATASSQEEVLVRLDRVQPVPVPDELRAAVAVVQELESAWLVRAAPGTVARLRALGASFATLDVAPAGKIYFLAYAASDDFPRLERAGTARFLEPGVYLLDARTESARELLPPSVSLKRLPDRLPVDVILSGPAGPRAVHRKTSKFGMEANPEVARIAARVSEERLVGFVSRLESFQTRYASTASLEAAGTAILEYFREAGLAAQPDYFTFGAQSHTTSNIVATIPGRTAPGRVVIVCAHYDSTSDHAAVLAPGADDNASGTAAVMEAAHALLPTAFDFTIRLIAFSAEEWGLIGSRHYTENARRQGEDVIAAINLDMIGYTDERRLPEDIDIIVDSRSEWLGRRFESVAAQYAPLPIRTVVSPSVRGSDHSPFWDQGYSALLAIEDSPLRNPHYHRTTDTLSTLGVGFMTAVTRAAVALAADLAQPVSAPPSPIGAAVGEQLDRYRIVALQPLAARTVR
ncbi:MAG: M28 family metallopeptidase [Vicinamibacterales bacterium]